MWGLLLWRAIIFHFQQSRQSGLINSMIYKCMNWNMQHVFESIWLVKRGAASTRRKDPVRKIFRTYGNKERYVQNVYGNMSATRRRRDEAMRENIESSEMNKIRRIPENVYIFFSFLNIELVSFMSFLVSIIINDDALARKLLKATQPW